MNVRAVIASQYHAALDMLEQAVVACPDPLWDDRGYANVFWHVAYHALFYTHLYLHPSREKFVPWPGRRGECESLGRGPNPGSEDQAAGGPYTRSELIAYLALCRQQVDEHVAAMAFDAPSGFHWLPFDKLELQFYNIRHLQHHTGELYERLGATGDAQLGWVAAKPANNKEYL